jgi:tetratricopeptide (TPR) repeat protein
LPAGHEHLEKAVTFHDPRRHADYVRLYGLDPGVYSRSGTHRTLWLLGHADQARTRMQESLEWLRQFSDPQSVAFILLFAAFFHQYCHEADRAGELADACIALCDEHGIVQEREWVAPVRGWVMAQQGKPRESIAYLRQSLARHRAMRSQLNFPYYLCLLIEVLLREGEIAEGLEAAEEGLQVVERTQQRSFLAEIYRLKGELLRARDADSTDAESLFERAIEIAGNQGSLALQLRAGISHCRATAGTKRWAEGRETLAGIYAQFEEGFGTPDLVEAKKLLNERGT